MKNYLISSTKQQVYGPEGLDMAALWGEFSRIWDHGIEGPYRRFLATAPGRGRDALWDALAHRIQATRDWRASQPWARYRPGAVPPGMPAKTDSFVTWLTQEHGCRQAGAV